MANPSLELSDLEVLVFDCQATHPDPARGFLFEMAWSRGTARGWQRDTPPPRALLLKAPWGQELPVGVRRVTGLETADLECGVSEDHAGEMLRRAWLAESPRGIPLVIHFSRYERPFLEAIFHGFLQDLTVLCTHEIGRRLLPELPRRSLRALAGYLGHPAPEFRRSGSHVEATRSIWMGLLERLRHEGVHTTGDLEEWMKQPLAPRSRRMFPLDRTKRLGLPDGPGVYQFLAPGQTVLYVGKAASLRRRVNSYFQQRRGQGENVLEMLSQAIDVKVHETGTALEAALLENDLIKRLSPPCNRALRRRWSTLVFTSSDLTQIFPENRAGSRGPLPLSWSVRCLCSLAAGPPWAGAAAQEDFWRDVPLAWDPGDFAQGVELFSGRWRHRLKSGMRSRSLLTIGAEIWRRRSQGASEGEEAETELEDLLDKSAGGPEGVANWIESGLMDGARMVRRSVWFRWLSGAELVWRGVRGGSCLLPVVEVEDWLDWREYDRLLVLTGELRRLIRGDRDVRLFRKEQKGLNQARLRNVLEAV